MKGLVFFDLDGTLLNKTGQVDLEVIEAIQQLKENGYEPLLATGRSPIEVSEVIRSTNIHSGVFMNGQVVIFKGEILIHHEIPKETIERLLQFAKANRHGITCYNVNAFKMIESVPFAKEAYEYIHTPTPDIVPAFYKEQVVNMMLLLSRDNNDEAYQQAFPELRFIRNFPYALDVITAGNSKATGIRALIHTLNTNSITTYAFGDGANDLEMFQEVDIAIAMGNAIPLIKEKANYVSADNDKGGIIQGLKHYHLI